MSEAPLHSRRYDLMMAAPMMVFYLFACAGFVLLIAGQWPARSMLRTQLAIAGEAATMLFLALQVWFLAVRRLPVAKSDGVWPRLTAMAGANVAALIVLVPRVTLSMPVAAAASILSVGGILAAFGVLFWLGRAFAVMPEARLLVTSGPFRVIRHPLYLAELTALGGIALQYRQPWAGLIVLVTLALQLRRMAYEEQVLARTFPQYTDYARGTWRLIPYLY